VEKLGVAVKVIVKFETNYIYGLLFGSWKCYE